ncbi:hypothetical protein [Succiniclasticum ruminis]|uniref:hypothetical protein n=1 Tax=Succiniclasticum ruminis TaxID=40841 RepID=UPI0015A602E2|nr:hypothetical protein [Succiniclasticum ruminis]
MEIEYEKEMECNELELKGTQALRALSFAERCDEERNKRIADRQREKGNNFSAG